jgi:hypothetical protein
VQTAESLRDLRLLEVETMTVGDAGTVVITGPTGGLGKPTTLEMARRTGSGPTCSWCQNLTEVAAEARAAGVKAHEIPCDSSRLSDPLVVAAMHSRSAPRRGSRPRPRAASVSPADHRC